MAILTTHTVHIAILPESSHLTAPDTGPLKLKTYTLGPTTHVTSQAGVTSALWHPLGVNGTCLVTVTEDAVVRVWELSTGDRWSFDRPTLAIDLKKLADGTSVDQDFGASISGINKGFSPDSFEMEVASACFSSRGSGGWYPMTLWIAMREGDVYALCPLLPEKWSPPPTLVPSLSVSIVAKVAAMEDDPEIPIKNRILAQQQLAWMSDIDIQEPILTETAIGEPAAEVYTRPSKPGRIPKLQGPFDFDLAPEESEDELDGLLSDIYVIGPKIDGDELMLGEENELEMEDSDSGAGLSVGVVCLLTSSGRLSICLDLDGIEAQWLPKLKSKTSRFIEEADPPSLLTFQVLDTLRNTEVGDNNWPTFSHDFNSRYSFYVTDISCVTFISLTPWVFRLENELNDSTAGTDFRVDLLVKGQNTIRERLYTQRSDEQAGPLAASTAIQDPDLGYFLLTATPRGPVSITFESPEFEYALTRRSESPAYDSEAEMPLVLCEPRPVYQPASSFEAASALPMMLEKLRHSKYKRILKEEVRLSPATLTIMTDAHKVLSEETYRIGTAAAELFRRCERLQIELRSQIQKTNEVANRVEAITGKDAGDGSAVTSNEDIERRIHAAKENQKKLVERIEGLKKRQARNTNRELSDRERAWVDEVALVESKIVAPDGVSDAESKAKEPWKRYEEVLELKNELLEQVRKLAYEEEEPLSSPTVKVPSEIRKAKIAQVMSLLDRESALVEGAKSRLERLSLA
jgi:nucleoporin NUP82